MRATLHNIIALIALTAIGNCSCEKVCGAVIENVPRATEGMLKRLDDVIANRSVTIKSRCNEIDSLVSTMPEAPKERAERCIDIAEHYKHLWTDSAIVYLRRARYYAYSARDTMMLVRSGANLAALLPIVDHVRETISTLDSLNSLHIPTACLREYYSCVADAYQAVAQRSDIPADLVKRCTDGAIEYRKKAMSCYPRESHEHLFHEAYRFYAEEKYSAAAVSGAELLGRIGPNSLLYTRTAELLANVYARRNKHDEELYYTVAQAISEVMRGDYEGIALQHVGHLLYSLGDIDRAHSYLTVALSTASYGGGYNPDMVTESLMIIDKSYHKQWQRNAIMFWWVIGIMAIALLMLTILLLRTLHTMKSVSARYKRMIRLREDRTDYIVSLVTIATVALNHMMEFSRNVQRKLAVRQFEEAFQLVKSGNKTDELRHDMSRIIDSTFLKLYPNFVAEVNQLLRPDEQFAEPVDEHLVPELRILALVKLGLSETAKMAEFLGYSTNTIYAYRAKTRARAIDPANFDRAITEKNSL